METKTENKEPKEIEPVTEWEKPTVTEFDVTSVTLSAHGLPGNFDGSTYS